MKKKSEYNLPKDLAHIPTKYGEFSIFVVKAKSGAEHVVMVHEAQGKKANNGQAPLVRIHSECFTGDILGSLRCDCRPQFQESLKRIGKEGGVLIYLRQEGRGIGLANKILAYALQEDGLDTVDANIELDLPIDARTYEEAAKILLDLGIKEVRLMTNNLDKVKGMEECKIKVIERIPLIIKPNSYTEKYLEAKKNRLGHLLD